MIQNEYSRLKIYASTTDKIGSKLLYEHLVYLAKEKGISGVTVFRGIMGYGASSKNVSTSRFWELTEKLPVVIEMIDNTPALSSFYQTIDPDIQKMKKGCLVTLEPIDVKLLKVGENKDLES